MHLIPDTDPVPRAWSIGRASECPSDEAGSIPAVRTNTPGWQMRSLRRAENAKESARNGPRAPIPEVSDQESGINDQVRKDGGVLPLVTDD
jgi:hypothetical protein